MKNNAVLKKVVIINTVIFIFITVVLPNGALTLMSLTKKDSNQLMNLNFTINNFSQALSPLFLKVYFKSLKVGIFASIICLLFGYAYAFIAYQEKNRPLKHFLFISMIIPFWTSSLIKTYSIIFILKLNGLLNHILMYAYFIDFPVRVLYSEYALIFGLIYALIPFMIVSIFLSLEKIDYLLIESAKDLGASSLNIFLNIIMPLSINGVFLGCSMVLFSSFGMFYLSDLLGGSKNLMIGSLVKNQILLINDLNVASAISIVFYLAVILGTILQKIIYKINLMITK